MEKPTILTEPLKAPFKEIFNKIIIEKCGLALDYFNIVYIIEEVDLSEVIKEDSVVIVLGQKIFKELNIKNCFVCPSIEEFYNNKDPSLGLEIKNTILNAIQKKPKKGFEILHYIETPCYNFLTVSCLECESIFDNRTKEAETICPNCKNTERTENLYKRFSLGH